MSRKRPALKIAEQPTYMSLLLSGEALPEEIDNFVALWHEAEEGASIAQLSLHDYLGMTWEEYSLWVEHPESLRFIAVAHKTNQPVTSVLSELNKTGVAARASEQSEAHKLLRWLIRKKKVEESPRFW